QLAKFLLVFLALQFFGSIGLGIWLFVHRCAGEKGRHFRLARCKTITTESKCMRLHLGVTEMLQFGASFACGRTTTFDSHEEACQKAAWSADCNGGLLQPF